MTGPPHSFDVYLEGELVFSKAGAGRFPEPGEIAAAIERLLAAGEADGPAAGAE